MTQSEWRASWSFVREHWQEINCGDLWNLLTPQQLMAASYFHESRIRNYEHEHRNNNSRRIRNW